MPQVHHIVLKGEFSTRNEHTQNQLREMQQILYDANISVDFDPMNLMLLSAGTHSQIHTDQYIAHVHSYIMSTDGSKEEIYAVLFQLRIEIATLDVFSFGRY